MADYYPLLRDVAVIFAFLVAYMLIVRRAADVVQPVRLKMARLGRQLLASKEVSASEKADVKFYLDHAFDTALPLMGAITILFVGPLYIGKCCYRAVRNQKSPAEMNGTDPRVKQLTLMFLLSSVAANPLFGTLMVLEILVTAIITTMLTRQLKAWQGIVKLLVELEIRGISHRHAHRW